MTYQAGKKDGWNDAVNSIEDMLKSHSKQNTYEGNEALVFKTTMNEVLGILEAHRHEIQARVIPRADTELNPYGDANRDFF